MRRVVIAIAVVAACRFDLDHAPTPAMTSTIDGASNMRQQCQINTVSSLCTNADALTDCSGSGSACFTYIKTKIFNANCQSTSCHSMGGNGKLDLSDDSSAGTSVSQATAYANLMGSDGTGAASMVDTTRKLVVAGHPEQSYLDYMIQKVAPESMVPPEGDPPSNIGYMPQANGVLCCQKLDLIDRWIAGGALNK